MCIIDFKSNKNNKIIHSIKEIINRIKEKFYQANSHTETFDLVSFVFVTSDGKVHSGQFDFYIRSSGLNCLPWEYAMIDVKDDGYLIGEGKTCYPLQNIISINFYTKDTISGKFYMKHNWEFKIYWAKKEIENLYKLQEFKNND